MASTELRAAAQQALEALETPIHEQSFMQKQNAITALRAALAEPVQEPVAVVRSVVGQGDDGVRIKWFSGFPQIGDRLYTAPPQRKPLSDEVIADLWHQNGGFHHHFARAIERWLRGHA